MIIRLENQADFAKIYHFTKEAFETAKVKDGDEQNFVERLRKSENYLPNLAFVAEKNEEIVGHIMLSKTSISNKNKISEVLILAPLTVRLDQRNQGLGGELIAIAEKEAKKFNYQMIILIGDPSYYSRHGFVQASTYGIISDKELPPEYLLAKIINPCNIKDFAGTVFIPV
ncbi:hypothetical protein A5821_000433 [Enterococcus sp. 7F3_DIV0205]|uniref:N-acetyltransferase domain-containing protein n=1 Tax=Candidatus Enterococcus palustris TaxID=1834189 RepID=A0AAQ3W5T9_9ENTE|nr:N-acetyltransferase [Enterococcus sp. 7F3_DIV0205]OTN84846.1 hypothetical protein A5821_000775 [Enterococcus sp. 7F3_DIV0205]